MQWIKADKKPEQNGHYLVVVGGAQIQIANYEAGQWQDEYRRTGLPLAVTHWMPLPLCPKN